jgi:predicted ATPase/DNA-binding winged helix-turn-helix (wHTH) protein
VVAAPTQTVSFGPFRLIPEQRLLLEGERPVRLGSRAMDILVALAERAGEQISKRELMARIWPDAMVVEANLAVHVAALRRALGDGQSGSQYIVNIPGRGYRFVAPVTVTADLDFPTKVASTAPLHNLPAHVTRLIGRAEDVRKLVHNLSSHRLLTIVGAAGVGKTAVVLEVAEELIPNYEHGVWLIDLASVADPRHVPTALASALGLEIRSDDPLPGLIAAVSDKRMLLVLDNCELVIEAAATLAAAILRGARGVQILATSREPLRVAGECVRRLSPLASPPPSVQLSAAEALGFAAVQLFVERAAATATEFALNDENASTIGDICRKLDGLPLAIELAAARVEIFGVVGLAARLDDRIRLLTGERRAALSRHKTISAALDWSYQLLSEVEQAIFRCLGIFAGSFTIEAAAAVGADTEARSLDIADTVASLVAKSLLTAEIGDGDARFRLLETMRAYAAMKLAQSGEDENVGRRRAAYYRDLLEARNRAAGDNAAPAFITEIDNIRAALTWAFASERDRLMAVALAAASAPLWLELSLPRECRGWAERGLALIEAPDRGARREMVLQTALGVSLTFSQGMSNNARAALTRAVEIAERMNDADYQLRALAGLTLICNRLEEFREALGLAQRSEAVAQSIADPVAISATDGVLGSTHFFIGDYSKAWGYAQRVLRDSSPSKRREQVIRFGINNALQGHTVGTHVLWVRGLLNQSARSIREALADADASGNVVSQCFALTWCGCWISLRLGDLNSAERYTAQLTNNAERHGLGSYHACGLGFEGELAAKRDDFVAAEQRLRACLDGLRHVQYELLYTPFLSGLAHVLAAAGRFADGLAAADEALQRTEQAHGLWWMPEALRVKGEISLSSGNADMASTERLFCRSLDLAHRQGALSWELRSAMSLGQLYHAQGRDHDASKLLNSVYTRFTEGFATADLKTARRLLGEWGAGETRGQE